MLTTAPAARTDAKTAVAGDCVWDSHGPISTDTDPVLVVVPCGDNRAQAEVLARPVGPAGDTECDNKYPESDLVFTHTTKFGSGPELQDFALCLKLK
ncbi:hypothetical protein [Nocardia sp. NPDC006630]|uniref:LppU/SCO3897 family protein n=1 Tax=Nocardia sp. NPDC006630 TaxID=3157181 RepID=UPI0033A2BC9E